MTNKRRKYQNPLIKKGQSANNNPYTASPQRISNNQEYKDQSKKIQKN